MNYLANISVCFLLFIFVGETNGQSTKKEIQFAEFTGPVKVNLVSGEKTILTLQFKINDGYHIQSNDVGDEFLIPTSMIFEPTKLLSIGDPVYPNARLFHIENSDTPFWVFSESIEIELPIINLEQTEELLVIKGILHYQPCDSKRCFYPRDLPFEIEVNSIKP